MLQLWKFGGSMGSFTPPSICLWVGYFFYLHNLYQNAKLFYYCCFLKVTEEMYKLLSEKGFDLVPRGLIKVKGKGEMMTYFLEGPRPHAEPKSWCSCRMNLNFKFFSSRFFHLYVLVHLTKNDVINDVTMTRVGLPQAIFQQFSPGFVLVYLAFNFAWFWEWNHVFRKRGSADLKISKTQNGWRMGYVSNSL